MCETGEGFYTDAASYWSGIEASLDGVLGGFGALSDPDVEFSRHFLKSIFDSAKAPPARNLALDCGAGIGRVSKHLLVKHFDKVDLVEQNAAFLEEAKRYVEPSERIGDLYPVGLQNFRPSKKYDVIWCQWVLGHLKDDHLVRFFILCRDSLDVNGLIIVKENVTSSNKLEKDKIDSSITRPLKTFLSIFKKSKLKIVKEGKQVDFPKGLYPVYMFALRPSNATNGITIPKEKNDNTNEDILIDNLTQIHLDKS